MLAIISAKRTTDNKTLYLGQNHSSTFTGDYFWTDKEVEAKLFNSVESAIAEIEQHRYELPNKDRQPLVAGTNAMNLNSLGIYSYAFTQFSSYP